MNQKLLWRCSAVTLLCAALFATGHALAQGESEGEMEDACACGEVAEMGAMPAWMMTGAEHEDLAKRYSGEWKVKGRWIMPEGQPDMMMEFGASASMAFGGKYLVQNAKGDSMGMPFEGQLTLGYDTIEKDYVAIWIDTWSPIASISRGQMKGEVLWLEGMDPDHMTATKKKVRMSVVSKSADEYVWSFFNVGADDKNTLAGELNYTRAK